MERNYWNKSLKSIYIFCEWFTEEYYFKFLKTLYRSTPVKINSIRNFKRWWEFKNVRKLNKKIIDEVRKDEKGLKWFTIDKRIYAIFDLDIFSKEEIDNLYNWIDSSIILIPSNMTFEYWILSHFQRYDLWNWKKEYLPKIIEHLKSINFKLEREKFTWDNDFKWINKENIELAVKNVKEINIDYWNLIDRDPYSEIYKVIEFLESK